MTARIRVYYSNSGLVAPPVEGDFGTERMQVVLEQLQERAGKKDRGNYKIELVHQEEKKLAHLNSIYSGVMEQVG